MSYIKIDPVKFALGLVMVTVPVWFLEKSRPDWVTPYIALILLSILVVNYEGIDQFARYLNKGV